MKRSTDRILTTHAGSLSRPANLIEMDRARASGESKDDTAYAKCLAGAVADVVREQRDAGIDIIDDGEFGKPMAAHSAIASGGITPSPAWQDSLTGFSPKIQAQKSSVANFALTTFADRRDWQKFSSSTRTRNRPARSWARRAPASAPSGRPAR